jgi:hypothetical protein
MLSPQDGWKLVTFMPAPELAAAAAPSQTIHLGPILGRGSFGTVHKAMWVNGPVAVKMIPHSARDASVALTSEAKLILTFNHPNVIKVSWLHASICAGFFGCSLCLCNEAKAAAQ